MNFLRQALAIAGKDLRAEWRGKETLNASLSFSVVLLLLFSFAFDPTTEELQVLSGGLLWIVFAFAAALVLNRSFVRDLPNDCLDALLASPVPAPALFVGKLLANYILLLAVEMVCLPVYGLFYNVPWTLQIWQLMGVMLLATWGVAVVGTLFSALTVNLRLREIMLPMLMYPILIPGLLAAVELTRLLVMGTPVSGDSFLWVRLLIGFDLIYTLLAVTLAETVLVG